MTAAHNKSQAVRRETGRVLRFLAQQAGAAALHINGDEAMLVAPHGGRAKAGMRLLTALASAGLVAIAEDRISATREADAWLRRLDGDWDYRAQHQTLERRDIEIGGEWRSVLVNADESPLATLRRLKDRCGRNWICDEEWAAGERLRRDFHLAQMSPRVSANW
ncbi:MAG TPA: DUF6456 domain-containing protein, partial [Rhizobiaceae bacterium]|nr:DUF6456 domain-containing protein [Rhizobiaceae bacterium]